MLIGVLLILFEFFYQCFDKNHEKKSKKSLNELRIILENYNDAILKLKQEIHLKETQIKTQDLNPI